MIQGQSAKPPVQAPPPSADAGPQLLLQSIVSRLEDIKAEDMVLIDLKGKTSIADVMIIVTGRSNVHVGAIADQVIKECKLRGNHHLNVEGLQNCDWVLVDAGDLIVHIFRPEVRQFYNLEKMWAGNRPGEDFTR